MKIRSMRWFIALIAVSLAFLGTIPAFAEDTGDAVTIEKERILIPGTKISEKDQREMNAILAKYDKKLYKVKEYANGKLKQSEGALKDAAIDKATAARAAAHAKDPHFTGSTLQAGFTTNQDIADVVTIQNTGNSAGSSNNARRHQDLVKRLEPILRKYAKKR